MKLRNKKTGEIAEVESCNSYTGTIGLFFAEGRECDRTYESLAELNSEWEDYEEPNERWYINDENEPQRVGFGDPIEDIENLEELGLLFKTEEEAKKAVGKLKAWKRLKDKGFKFFGNKTIGEYGNVSYTLTCPVTNVEEKDLDLLFGEY